MTPVAVHHRLGLLLQFYLSLRTVFFFSAMGNTISTQCEADTWNLRSYFCLFSWLSFSSGAAEFPGSRDRPSDVPLADRLSGGPSLCPWSPVYLHWQHSSFHFFLSLVFYHSPLLRDDLGASAIEVEVCLQRAIKRLVHSLGSLSFSLAASDASRPLHPPHIIPICSTFLV